VEVQVPVLFDDVSGIGGGELIGVGVFELLALWSVEYIYNTLLFFKKWFFRYL